MVLARLALCLSLFGLAMVAAAPSRTNDYTYKVAKRDEIVRRGTRTRPHYRRASPLPGQGNYAVFENYYIGGSNTAQNSYTVQPTFGSCAALCTATSGCDFFRWDQRPGNGFCNLRTGTIDNNISSDTIFRAALRGVTCAQAKAQYPQLAPGTCSEEFY